MRITRKSTITGIERSLDIPVNPDDYIAWETGLVGIHEAMPYLINEHSEFILSGITPDEWKQAFAEQHSA